MRGYLRIGELSRRTGVSETTLRAWERRYALLRPERSGGGFRLYADDDVARVRSMQEHLERGVSASQAARLALDEPRTNGVAPAEGLANDLSAALEALDDVAVQAAVDRTLATLTVEGALRDVLLPVMSGVGRGWEDDQAAIAREHFATNLVRGRLLALARGWDLGGGPRALLACAPEEQHDLGLIAFGLALRARGWRITYLGPSTPVTTLAEAARLTEPALIVLSSSLEQRLKGADVELRDLASRFRLALGGPGATDGLASRVGAELLAQDPLDAAASV
ncbi:MAG: MerR family transcriptional regulator [Actinomycetota bacterium]